MLQRLQWALAVGLVALVSDSALSADVKPPWTGDYAAARAEARRLGKPMLLVFRCVP